MDEKIMVSTDTRRDFLKSLGLGMVSLVLSQRLSADAGVALEGSH